MKLDTLLNQKDPKASILLEMATLMVVSMRQRSNKLWSILTGVSGNRVYKMRNTLGAGYIHLHTYIIVG